MKLVLLCLQYFAFFLPSGMGVRTYNGSQKMRRIDDLPSDVERQRYEAQQEAAAALESAATNQKDFLGRTSQDEDVNVEGEKTSQDDSSPNVYERFASVDAEFHAQMDKVHSVKERGEEVSDEDQLKLRNLHDAAIAAQEEVDGVEQVSQGGHREGSIVEHTADTVESTIPETKGTPTPDENDPVQMLAAASERFVKVDDEFHAMMEKVDAAKKRGEAESAEDQSKLHTLHDAAREGQREIDRFKKLAAAKQANSADAKQIVATAKANFDNAENKFQKLRKDADDAKARGDELDDTDKNDLKEAQEAVSAAQQELSDLRNVVEGTHIRQHTEAVSENIEVVSDKGHDAGTQNANVLKSAKTRLEREQNLAAKAKREAEEALDAVARAKEEAEALQKEAEEQALLWAAEKQRSHRADRKVKTAKKALQEHHKRMKKAS